MHPGLSKFALHTGKVGLVASVAWALQMPGEPEAATSAATFNVTVALQDAQTTTGCLNRSQVKSSNALVTVTCDSGQFVSISAVAVVPGTSFINPLLSGQTNSLMDGSRATLVAAAPGSAQGAGSSSTMRRQTGTVTATRAETVVVNAPGVAAGSITSMRLSNATTELTPVDLVVTF